MKFFALLPVFLTFASSVFATSSSLTRRHHNDVIQARQAKISRGVTADICANLDLDLTLPTVIRDGKAVNVGHLSVSLCVSLVAEFVRTNSVCQLAAVLITEEQVIQIITTIIKQHQSSTTCNLPEHGHSSCQKDNLCNYDCQHGYQPYTTPGDSKPSSCYCPAPMSECNGQCGNFPNGCGSATPKRRSTRRAAPPSCPRGATICGVAGNPTGWECIEVEKDKESCGACMIPPPFGVHTEQIGTNCKDIPNVDAVDCASSKCVIQSCKAGFAVTPNKDACAPVDTTVPQVEKRNNFINLKNLQKGGEGPGLISVSA
ncbi:hypothetical protein QCA50_007151 [Cerrena zonata]|uniref:Protein CPL1-like domain-containing protein n=1 Tax=Cerrena zonata TaxID=2478898 RepID=A0AAW0GDZ7_9APHY